MELAKNVFFNTDKLIETTKVKISYTGELTQKNNENIFIHYGFGEQWDNVSELKMEKTDLGFTAKLDLPKSNQLNFCFRNDNNEWDNNNQENYVFPIEKIENIEMGLTVVNQPSSLIAHRRLRRSYLLNKKIKLAFYKAVTYIPRLFKTSSEPNI